MSKTKKTKKTKQVDELKSLPSAASNEVTAILSIEEIISLIQILSLSKEVFFQMSLNSVDLKDEKVRAAFASKSEISAFLCDRLKKLASIGEPTSREVH